MNKPETLSKEEYFDSLGYEWAEVEAIIRHYKYYKRVQGDRDTIHHRIAKVRGGSEVKQNRAKIKARDHWNLHGFFENKLPGEQLSHVITINSPILKRTVRKRLNEVIHETRSGLYIPNSYS